MFLRLTLLAVAGVLALGGCAGTPPAPKTPRQAVYEAELAYEVPLQIAVRYNKLQRCGTLGAPLVCADPAIVAAIRSADADAKVAISSAIETADTPGVSDSAVTLAITGISNGTKALQQILDQHGIK